MEEKLIELLGTKEYYTWSSEIAKKLFREDIEEMPDSEFKDFLMDNFVIITDKKDGR